MTMRTRRVPLPLALLLACCSPDTTWAYISNPVVIAPGFMNDSADYDAPYGRERHRDSAGLVSALERRGFDEELIMTVPVRRADWFRTMGGLLDGNTYRDVHSPTGAETCPSTAYGWYLERFRDTIDEAYAKSGGERVIVVGHSAGGWLARAGLGDGLWQGSGRGRYASDRVGCLATIGAIHRPPVRAFPFFTRGALAHTERMYPGAFLREDGVGYVSVGSDAIVGASGQGKDGAKGGSDPHGLSSRSAYTAYELVCGRGDVGGDGVVPLEWTQLEGARQIQLDDVLHSFSATGPTDRWYGADGVIDRWLPAVLEEAGISI